MMFEAIDKVRDLRKRYNYKMFSSGVGAFRAFEQMEADVLKDGALPRKHKELISLAISIVSSCYGCIEYHTTQALENGATRAEIAEAAALAVCLGGGTVQWPARYVFDVLEQLEQEKSK